MSLSPFKLYCQRCHVVDRKDCNCNWYQKKRNENLARNEEVLRELGFGATHYEVHEKSTTTKRKSSGTDVPLERRISPRTNSFSESRGSRPTLSKAKLESLPFIICEDCDKKIYNKKNLTDEVLLRWHQVNSRKSCGPVRQIDTEMPLGCTFDDIDDESDNDIFHDENGFVETSGSESEWGTYNDSESNSGGDDENSETFSESDFENDDAETYFVDAEMDYDDAEIDQEGNEATESRRLPIYNSRHLEIRPNVISFNPAHMKPRKDILRRQKRMQAAKKTNVKFRNLGSHGDRVLDSVQWKTLTRIYQFGLSVGLSRSQGDELLKMMQLVLDENGSHIQLRKTWRSLKVSIGKQKVKGSYSIGRFKYELPKDYFGTKHWRSQRPLRCFNASAVDIRCVLADILMSVNNQEQCKFTFVTPKDEHGVAVPRDEQILEGFCTGDRFKAISEYYDQLPPIRGLHIVPILLKISLDDTTLSASRVTSECPVYISVMNIEGQEQPLHHLGFAPRHLPYSEDDMRKQLAQQGITTNKHQDQILSEVKVKVVRDFLFDILKPVTRFGKNLFELMVGSGRHAQCVLGAIHVCVVGGDGKELDLLCGCQHSRRRNCRMCLEWRHNLFTRPTQNSEIRLDSVHEQVSYDLVELNKRIFAGIYDGGRKKRYIKSPEDRILLQRGQTYCIQAGESKLYRLFYHFNSVGISSLHTSVFPDMLHVVLKGIIEKTLAGVLLVVNTSQKLFDKKSYGNAMGLLDFRTSRMAPVHNLDWMRWVSFSNGLSQILKTESRSAAKSDNSTGLMSGGMFSWKLVSGLFQAMFAIGSSGTILPIGHKMKEFGFTHPLIQDLSEVVLSACASVLEMYAALHAKRCRYKDVRIVEYLVHNACFHYVRLAGLLKALSHSKVDKHRKRKPIKVNDATMCIWGVGGNKFHYLQRHMSIVKREMGANMDSTDTQQSEKGHITFVKTSYQASSKRSSTRQTEMCDRNVTMRMICQMQLDSPAEGLIQPEDSKTGDIKTQTVSSASSTPFTRLRMIKKSHTSFYCWTNESGKSSRSYLHPLVNSHIVSEAISDITEEYSSGNIHELRVYLMESVIIEEIDGCKWKIQCEANHCVGRTSDGHYDGLSVHQFSGAFIRLKTIGIKECVRIFGIILYQWVVNGAKVSRYRFIGSRMIAPDTVHRSYLPYDVVTHQRIGRKIDICFIDDDELLGPAIFVPLVESRVDWGTESKQDLLGEGTHLFYMLDPMRFSFPKSSDFDSTFYTNLSADSELQRPNESRPVFFTMEALKRWQVELGLESVEPRHEMLDDTEIASWFDTN